MRTLTLFAVAVAAVCASAADLPLKEKSIRFAVIGDNGTGEKPQYEIGQQMEKFRQKISYNFVIMDGDNIYGGESAADFKKKFEDPYAPLLGAGVKFYASLGNHDNPNQRFYKPYNMNEKRYYNFKNGNVEFFALDSNYMDGAQLDWLTQALKGSTADWKICFFHHPLYSDGKFHGPDTDLRARLEPIFTASGVNVVFTGHEHFYERVRPQKGIYYFIEGSSGELRPHDLKSSGDIDKGFDTDRAFMVVEVSGDQMFFQTISRTGETVDSGTIDRQNAKKN
jgi:hypothetical protein